MSIIFKMHRLPRLLTTICVALTISAPIAAAYVATGKSANSPEQTSSQIDRSNKSDRLHLSPEQKPVGPNGAKQMEPLKRLTAPHMVA